MAGGVDALATSDPSAHSVDALGRRPPTPRILLAVAAVVFPPFGLNAVRYQRMSAHVKDDRRRMLHYAAKARLWSFYALGAAFTTFIVGFLVLVFVMNDFAVTKDYLNPKYLALSLPGILKAFGQNVILSVVAYATSLTWGLVLAIARGLPGPAAAPIRFLAVAYIDLFRGLPALLTFLIIGFGLPQTGLPIVTGMNIFASGILAMTVLYGAYLAEILRSGIESVHPSQVAAARSIGLDYGQTMRFVVLPQAVSRMIPPLLSWYISALKDTSLLSVLGLLEAVNVSRIMVTNQSNLSALTGVSLCFLLVTIPLSRLTDRLIRKNQARYGR
jgi:polar amino acid transport system permease protein